MKTNKIYQRKSKVMWFWYVLQLPYPVAMSLDTKINIAFGKIFSLICVVYCRSSILTKTQRVEGLKQRLAAADICRLIQLELKRDNITRICGRCSYLSP